MYKTEAHIHTKESSICGKADAARLVEIYKEKGFHTLFITDHINNGAFMSWEGLSWEERIDRFYLGYEEARRRGDEIGVRVLFAVEVKFMEPEGNMHDYLVYGLDREFLKSHPYFNIGSLEEFLEIKPEGALLLQAHPYRNGCYPTPDLVDGIEVCNAHPRHENHNDSALALAKERSFPVSVGSDVHMEGDAARAYVLTDEPIETVEDYIEAIRSGSCSFVTPYASGSPACFLGLDPSALAD